MVRPVSKTRHPEATGNLEGVPAVIVERDDVCLTEPGGQLRLDFGTQGATSDVGAIERGAEEAPKASGPTPQPQLATITSVMGPDDWFERAVRLEEHGELDEAAAAYEKVLEEGEPSAEVAFNLGNVLFSLGRAEEAIARFEAALELDPEYVEAWNNLASVYAELGSWEEAIETGQSALALAPDYPDTHYNLAEAYFASGRLKDARRHGRIYLSYDYGSDWAKRLRWKLGLGHT